jgi:ferrous iron transport protein B
MYLIGVFLALMTALIINKTLLKGQTTPFVMELPPYRMPTLRSVSTNTWQKTQKYLKKAGTMLLAASILIWAAVSFPKPNQNEAKYTQIKTNYIKTSVNNDSLQISADTYIEKYKSEEALEYSVAGRIGKVMEPIVKPIGFDWKIATSVVAGFAAKEVVVSTLGVLYKVGKDNDEESMSLRQALRNDATFNPLVAYILMLFTLIVAPCIAALSTIKAEIGWRWLIFGVLYTFLLAYGLGFVIYQLGTLFKIGV